MSNVFWGERLGYDFFARETALVARELLGKWLVHHDKEGLTGGIIVETEAYLGMDDPACHAARGCTPRNRVMFGPAGIIYIYFIYGVHYCLNVTTASPKQPEAVLIRALEPRVGLELMERRRKRGKVTELCSGPGKLVQALGITKQLNGSSALEGPIGFYANSEGVERPITVTTRVGISKAVDWPLRYYLTGNPYVSRS
ncbi:DNA-3-methyladenine glycosylase [Zhaonella formicivorans]|uniref:DNA-3-methyladenine glycosylase n=1 Tax=Zhaonella formicivorans TaxID=2528593 RepID=UPI0010F2E95E|nr:DNA-3-methyladenine glycosylase [Zhaonella formicivorans]